MSVLGKVPDSFLGKPDLFPEWLINFENYCSVSVVIITTNLTGKDKLSLFKNVVGNDTCKIIDGLGVSNKSYKDVIATLKKHFQPEENVIIGKIFIWAIFPKAWKS